MKSKIIFDNIEFDSEGELLCYHYLTELKNNGYVDNFIPQPESFTLSDKIEYIYINTTKNREITTSATLIHPHVYTSDFKVLWNIKAKNVFYLNLEDKVKLNNIPFIAQNNISYLEIKPGNFDFNNMTRIFSINSKWVYSKYGIYVQKITPTSNKKNCLFAETFVPQLALYTAKTKKLKSFKYTVRNLQEFVNVTK
jgi:hypothetical protein